MEKNKLPGRKKPDYSLKGSITPEWNAEYMAAVEAGDMEKAQEMGNEAARAAGYTVRGYHGTTQNFTVFDRSKGNAEGNRGKGFYPPPIPRRGNPATKRVLCKACRDAAAQPESFIFAAEK